jgi:hypothetical protein
MSDTDQTDNGDKSGNSGNGDKNEMIETLERWSAALADELGLPDLDVDIDAVLALAGVAAHAVLRPAAPVTTYLVGYAAGRAAALDGLSATQATAQAAQIAADLARRHQK